MLNFTENYRCANIVCSAHPECRSAEIEGFRRCTKYPEGGTLGKKGVCRTFGAFAVRLLVEEGECSSSPLKGGWITIRQGKKVTKTI